MKDLGGHKSTQFTREGSFVDKALRSAFFDNLEEIGGAYEIKEPKQTAMMKRPYQCGIVAYQLAKLIKTRRDSELKDTDKAKNVGFRVYYQDMVHMSKTSLDVLLNTISVMS